MLRRSQRLLVRHIIRPRDAAWRRMVPCLMTGRITPGVPSLCLNQFTEVISIGLMSIGEDLKKPTYGEAVEAILADEAVAKSLPAVVGQITVKEQLHPNGEPGDELTETDVVLREGYNSVPGVALVFLLDLLRSAADQGASEEYLLNQLRRTGLKLHQARLRYPCDQETIELF